MTPVSAHAWLQERKEALALAYPESYMADPHVSFVHTMVSVPEPTEGTLAYSAHQKLYVRRIAIEAPVFFQSWWGHMVRSAPWLTEGPGLSLSLCPRNLGHGILHAGPTAKSAFAFQASTGFVVPSLGDLLAFFQTLQPTQGRLFEADGVPLWAAHAQDAAAIAARVQGRWPWWPRATPNTDGTP